MGRSAAQGGRQPETGGDAWEERPTCETRVRAHTTQTYLHTLTHMHAHTHAHARTHTHTHTHTFRLASKLQSEEATSEGLRKARAKLERDLAAAQEAAKAELEAQRQQADALMAKARADQVNKINTVLFIGGWGSARAHVRVTVCVCVHACARVG